MYGERQAALLPARLLLPADAAHARGQGPAGGSQARPVRQALVSIKIAINGKFCFCRMKKPPSPSIPLSPTCIFFLIYSH